MSEENLQILKMIEEGKITAAEGTTLLKAIEENRNRGTVGGEKKGGDEHPRVLRIKATNTETGTILANVTIPLGLVTTGLRMGAQFVPGIDQHRIIQAVREAENGQRGKLLEYQDDTRTEHIELFAE